MLGEIAKDTDREENGLSLIVRREANSLPYKNKITVASCRGGYHPPETIIENRKAYLVCHPKRNRLFLLSEKQKQQKQKKEIVAFPIL